jgi:hypothetical protein
MAWSSRDLAESLLSNDDVQVPAADGAPSDDL